MLNIVLKILPSKRLNFAVLNLPYLLLYDYLNSFIQAQYFGKPHSVNIFFPFTN